MILRVIFKKWRGEFSRLKIVSKLRSRYEASISESAHFVKATLDNVILGKRVMIRSGNYITLATEKGAATSSKLIVGDDTFIGENNNIRPGGSTIEIGKQCMIAQNISLIGSNHGVALGLPMREQKSSFERSGIVIEDDVWIGANSVILPGVTIGEGAIIGAGSVVTKSVAPFTINAGNPCRKIKSRS